MSIYGYGYLSEKYLENFYNISSDEIQSLSENNNYISLDESNAIDKFIDVHIIKSGMFGANIILSIKQLAQDIGNTIKQYGLNKITFDKINIDYDNFVQNLTDGIDMDKIINKYPEFSKYDRSKIAKSILLTIHTVAVETIILYTIYFISGNAVISNTLLANIVAPICEELAKRISIKGEFETEFLIVFNIYESAIYIKGMIKGKFGQKIKFIQALAIRLGPILMHITTTIVQFLTQDKDIQSKLGLTKPEDKAKLSNLGNLIGFLIHALWNKMGSKAFVIKIILKFK